MISQKKGGILAEDIIASPKVEKTQWSLERALNRIHTLEKQLHDKNNELTLEDERIKHLLDASPVPYALNNENKEITYLNTAFTRTFGYDLNDVATLDHWWPLAYPDPDYRLWVNETWADRLSTAKKTGEPFQPVELNIRCKDGTLCTVVASAASLSRSFTGNHLVILFDITERIKIEQSLKEQERELMEIIDHIPSMIFLKDAEDLRYVRFNRAGETLTGISQQDIIGKTDYDFFPEAQADFFRDRDSAVLSSGQQQDIPDEPIDTPNGTRLLHTRKVAINHSNGSPKYLLGISDDITELKQEKKEKERLQRELLQSQKMDSLGQLAGGIAHDFNNLLTIIFGYTSLSIDALKNHNNSDIISYMQQVKSATERAIGLVSQMLSFSRSDQGDDTPVDLGSLVLDDAKMLRATLPSTIEIQTDIDHFLPKVTMNATQLHQILMNLSINARDAMDAKGTLVIKLGWAKNLNLESSVSHKPIKGDWIELSIKDDGCGFDPELIDEIFTPFYTTKEVGKGTGMGLSVVYGIVNPYHGHILVKTNPGEGSCFRILFPPVSNEQRKLPDNVIITSANLNGVHNEVLVVDDEPSIAKFLEELLTQKGYIVSAITDSKKALQLFRVNPKRFSLVITDQTMPKLTGLELVDLLRVENPRLPVILCSGYSQNIEPNELKKKSICFLQKPLDYETLLNSVEQQLTQTSQRPL